MSFCTKIQMYHILEDPVIDILQVFGHRVLCGHYYSWVSSARADMVASDWCAITKTHLLESRQNPWKPLGSHNRDLD